MKNTIKWILLALGLAALLLLAVFGYRALSESYRGDKDEAQAQTQAQTEAQTNGQTEPQTAAEATADFTVTDTQGEDVKLSDFFGKPIVVNFWASWCYPCKSELPAFDNAYRTYGDEVAFMLVNLTDGYRETREGVEAFVTENGYSFPVYFDTAYDASNAYAVYSIPLTVFISSDGSVADTHLGAMSEDDLISSIEGLLGG